MSRVPVAPGEPLPVLKPDWPAHPRVHAAMTLRTGGVSATPYDALNLGTHVGDDLAAVTENRKRVRDSLKLPVRPRMAGAGPWHLSRAPRSDDWPSAPLRADAAVTHEAGPVCVIQVADCLPVLLASKDGAVVGAAHAGWRGLAGGVLEATAVAMNTPPAKPHRLARPRHQPTQFRSRRRRPPGLYRDRFQGGHGIHAVTLASAGNATSTRWPVSASSPWASTASQAAAGAQCRTRALLLVPPRRTLRSHGRADLAGSLVSETLHA